MSFVVERITGSIDVVTMDMSHLLGEGETISGTPTIQLSNALVSLVSGSTAVNADGDAISARFNHAQAGDTRVDITYATNLAPTKKAYFVFVTYDPPAS